MSGPLGSSRCPACGTAWSAARHRRGRGSTGYRCCPTCGLGVIDPWPAAGAEEPYDEGYFVGGGHRAGYADYEADARWHRHTARRRLDRLARALPGGTDVTLLDVGAAVGYVLDEARGRGWAGIGLDRSDWAVARGRARGHRMVTGWSELEELRGTLTAVTFFQVLEHIEDPGSALRAAAALLRPGGVVICETWDAASRTSRWAGDRWQQLRPPSVLWLFTPDSAGRLVDRAGLQRVSWRPTWKMVGAGTVLGQSLRSRPGRPAAWAATVVSRVGVPYPLDDLVTFVARTPL